MLYYSSHNFLFGKNLENSTLDITEASEGFKLICFEGKNKSVL